jgi:hypothetical protein
MVIVSDPYEPRFIRFIELWKLGGWTLKVYGISRTPEGPGEELRTTARAFAVEHLPLPPAGDGRYGVGFVGIHAGKSANVVFVDWWSDENELHHHVALSDLDDPARLVLAAEDELTACAWDVALICFERTAWLAAVLAAAEPSLERYLDIRYEALV